MLVEEELMFTVRRESHQSHPGPADSHIQFADSPVDEVEEQAPVVCVIRCLALYR